MTAFSHLFQPIRIGSMTVKNRLLMSAMSINFGVDQEGYVTEQLIGYMAARARGGVGMMLVGGGGIDPGGRGAAPSAGLVGRRLHPWISPHGRSGPSIQLPPGHAAHARRSPVVS
jgi:2,4-dienoyl-CoA reductase-like NADH-dependent reductase (Old Yellow Enzyme family)